MSTETEQPIELPSEGTVLDGRVEPTEPSINHSTFRSMRYGEDGEVGAAIGQLIAEVLKQVMDAVGKDNAARSQFTQDMVSTLCQAYPQFNWVIVHTSHTKKFDGREGYDWGHGRGTFRVTIGPNVDYDIYYCRSGVFSRYGDGGYLNWAWIGSISGVSSDGKIVLFRSP